MEIIVPKDIIQDGNDDRKFDTSVLLLSEENMNAVAMSIADRYAEWAYVAAKLNKNLLDLERAYNDWEPKALAIVEADAKAQGIVFKSEKAKQTALFNHKDQNGMYDFAEYVLAYENKKSELSYYVSLVEDAILKPLSIQKDMLVSLGANFRAGI